MGRYKDLTGQKFGRLTVMEYAERDTQRVSLWKCKCECGKRVVVRGTSLRYGSTQSCGCLRRERALEACTTHGLSGGKEQSSRLYRIWRNMKSRCFNSKTPKFKNHGGRGITICSEWLASYVNFHEWATNNGYKDSLVIERIDNNGNYDPGNCKWATYTEQNLNKRENHRVTFKGETKTLTEWGAELGIKFTTLSSRLTDYGWGVEKTLNTPVGAHRKRVIEYQGETRTLSEWSKKLGLGYKLLHKRLVSGWGPERILNTPIVKEEKK